MAEFYDISEWQEKRHLQTGGTRNKAIFENPQTGNLYYFKTSLKKEVIDYKYEFWSEIIASEIGKALGFNVLRYDIACHKGEIGCISKSMIDTNKNKLSEGIDYLVGYDPGYNPDSKGSYSQYTFRFIEKALSEYRLKDKMDCLVKTIIFDSLIGNGDRHQENWGFIVPNIEGVSRDDEKDKNKLLDTVLPKLFWRLKIKKRERDIIANIIKGEFSPIYDSGSCLGRELTDEKVNKMLQNSKMLESYIDRDKCEIRWEDNKLSHYELINKIRKETEYRGVIENEIKRVASIFKTEEIEKTVNNIDLDLPENLKEQKMPENRKNLIVKLLSLRFERLKDILNEVIG
ncbi:MAG: hypothetical protein LBG96_12045 [Tannerella sp.]|jgi:hypothetical protein|nr:hypothetical protein [Tannerella sp.]